MNNSIKDYHRKPTYDELIQEAIIHPTDIIKYPNRIATQLRNSPMLTRFDDEAFLDVNVLNSNAMKQNLQQTALQKATQPVARNIKTGLEQFDIFDTDETIQQQADDNTADLEDLQASKKKKDADINDIFEDALSNPSQIDDIITSRGRSGGLRGFTSSSSSSASPLTKAALPEEDKPDDTKPSTTATAGRGGLRGFSSSSSSAAAAASSQDENQPDTTPLKPVNQIVHSIDMVELEMKANKHLKHLITEIKLNVKNDVKTTAADDKLKERFEIQTLLTELHKFNKFNPNKLKTRKSKTPQTMDDLADMHDIYLKLTKILDKSK